MPALVQIRFDHPWDEETLQARAKEFSKTIKPQIPGLIWKIFTRTDSPRQTCGIYLFETLAAAQAYAPGDRVRGMQDQPGIDNVSVHVSEVMSEASALAGAPV